MDRNLPNIEGTSFIKDLRANGYQNPVIYVTAKDKSEDILDGFEAHADDYITKPFNIQELLARVKSVIKRSSNDIEVLKVRDIVCLLYTSDAADERSSVDLGGRRIIKKKTQVKS